MIDLQHVYNLSHKHNGLRKVIMQLCFYPSLLSVIPNVILITKQRLRFLFAFP